VDTKAVPLEIVELKAGSDGWQFSAYASTFRNRDAGGDVILPGAFDRTLKMRDWRPLLWQHDQRQPIGIEKSLKTDDHGLLGTWELIDAGPGEYAYKALKKGAVRSMSIGYVPEEIEYDETGDSRLLVSIELYENSVVSLPMNEQALVTGVKNREQRFSDVLATLKKHISEGVAEAEALHARRTSEKRKLTDLHRDAIDAFLDELEGSRKRLEALLRDPAPDQVAEATSDARAVLLALRAVRARQSARAHGVEV